MMAVKRCLHFGSHTEKSNLKHLLSIFFGVAVMYFLKNGQVGQVVT